MQRRLAEALDGRDAGCVLSLCAGEGRDIIPVLAELGVGARVEAVLVDSDPGLAASARRRAVEAAVPVHVVVGDAGSCATWSSAVPVDVLMLCGIFGNISDNDVRLTIQRTPHLLKAGGVVIWTRGGRPGADLRPQVREWFRSAGLEEVSFDQEETGFGVGMNRRTSQNLEAAPALPDRLFSFVR